MSSAPRSRRPTVRDVATEAGVSVASVSRVLASASKPVSDDTRAKVLAAAQKLGYAVNAAAKSLATGRSGMVGVVVPDLGNQYFTTIVQAIVHAARADDFRVLVGDSLDAAGAETELARETMLRSDGLILCSPRSTDESILALLDGEHPVVTVNRRVDGAAGVSSVSTDVLGATRALVEHLFARGHTALAFVGASALSQQMQARWQLIQSMVAQAGGRCWQIPLDTEEPDLGGALGPLVADGCTGIIAANDLQAAAVLQSIGHLGIRAPEQVSVVGFDDTPLARWLHPRLTTAGMHEREVGRAAWSAMRNLLLDPSDVTHVEFTAEAVFRDSVAAAPSGTGAPLSNPSLRG